MKNQKTPTDNKFKSDLDSWIKKKLRRNIDPYNLALDTAEWTKNYLNCRTWISVKDKLPKCGMTNGFYDNVPVIAWDGKRSIPCYYNKAEPDNAVMGEFFPDGFYTDSGNRITGITHWMELPSEGPV